MKPINIHNQILDDPHRDYLILAGPTAVGKTDTVMSLAETHDIPLSTASRLVSFHTENPASDT